MSRGGWLRRAERVGDVFFRAVVVWAFCGIVLTLAGLILVLGGDASRLDVIILCVGVLVLAALAMPV